MKVLVTGATGFIGNYVVKELLNREQKVIATSSNQGKAINFDWFNKVEYIQQDIHHISGNLVETFSNPEALIHLAWSGLPNYKKLSHIEDEMLPQFLFIKNLVSNGLKNINIVGTCFEYGMQEGKLSETMQADPMNAYSIAKDTLRKCVELLQQESSFSLKWLRLFYMYGQGQNERSILAQLQKSIDEKQSVFKMSLGEQIRDYLPVEMVAKYIVDCSLQSSIDGIINIASNKPIKIIKLVETYLNKTKQTISLNLGAYPYPDFEPFSFWGDNTKLLKVKS